MAVYKYTAKDINSKRITGKMEVNSRNELAAFLRSKEQYLIDCKDVTNTQQSNDWVRCQPDTCNVYPGAKRKQTENQKYLHGYVPQAAAGTDPVYGYGI